jgi:hypothetical protein
MWKSLRNNNQEPEILNPVRKELGRYILFTYINFQKQSQLVTRQTVK